MIDKKLFIAVVLCLLPAVLPAADYYERYKSDKEKEARKIVEERARKKRVRERELLEKWKKVPLGENEDDIIKLAKEFFDDVYNGYFSSAKEKSTGRAREEVEKMRLLKKENFREYMNQNRYFREIIIGRTVYWPNPKEPHLAFIEARLLIRNKEKYYFILLEKIKGKWLVSDMQQQR